MDNTPLVVTLNGASWGFDFPSATFSIVKLLMSSCCVTGKVTIVRPFLYIFTIVTIKMSVATINCGS